MKIGTNAAHYCPLTPYSGSTITNGREPRSCLGRVFNSKLGCIGTLGSKCMVYMQPLLKLKTWPRARPIS
jgi:hypothetical protein